MTKCLVLVENSDKVSIVNCPSRRELVLAGFENKYGLHLSVMQPYLSNVGGATGT